VRGVDRPSGAWLSGARANGQSRTRSKLSNSPTDGSIAPFPADIAHFGCHFGSRPRRSAAIRIGGQFHKRDIKNNVIYLIMIIFQARRSDPARRETHVRRTTAGPVPASAESQTGATARARARDSCRLSDGGLWR
jgi:hypothetical protein